MKKDDREYLIRLLMLGSEFSQGERGDVYSEMRKEGKEISGTLHEQGLLAWYSPGKVGLTPKALEFIRKGNDHEN